MQLINRSYLPIIGRGRDKRVVKGTPVDCLAPLLPFPAMRVPVGVEDGGRVSAEERQLVRRAAALVDGDDGKGAAAARLPVDGYVLGVCLCGVSADSRGRVRR